MRNKVYLSFTLLYKWKINALVVSPFREKGKKKKVEKPDVAPLFSGLAENSLDSEYSNI